MHAGVLVRVLADVRLVEHRIPDALRGYEHFVSICAEVPAASVIEDDNRL